MQEQACQSRSQLDLDLQEIPQARKSFKQEEIETNYTQIQSDKEESADTVE